LLSNSTFLPVLTFLTHIHLDPIDSFTMTYTYTFNEKTGEHRLRFGLSWPDNYDQATAVYTFAGGWGKFIIYGARTGSTCGYSIKLDEVNDSKYRVFESCSVNVMNGKWLAYNAIEILPSVVDHQFCKYVCMNTSQKGMPKHFFFPTC